MDIEEAKVDIEEAKVDLESTFTEKGQAFSAKTTTHIHRLFEQFGFDGVFSRSAVMELLELKGSGASKLVQRNWLLGYRIAEEEFGGEERSEYGMEVIKKISKDLTKQYGKGYDRSNLYHCLRFYKNFPKIVDTVCRQSRKLLSWSHYVGQMRILRDILLCTAMNNYLLPSISFICRRKKNCEKKGCIHSII